MKYHMQQNATLETHVRFATLENQFARVIYIKSDGSPRPFARLSWRHTCWYVLTQQGCARLDVVVR